MSNPIIQMWAIVNVILLVAFFTTTFLVVILGINGAGCFLGAMFVTVVVSGILQGIAARALEG